MKIEEMRARLGEVRDELEQLLGHDALDDEQEARYDELETEATELLVSIDKAEARAAKLEEVRAQANKPAAVVDGDGARQTVRVNTSSSDPFDLSGLPAYGEARNREVRARAKTAIETSTRFLSDDHKEHATRLLQRLGADDYAAEFILLGASEAYADGFLRALTGQTAGVAPDLSPEERQALTQRRYLARAMGLSDVTGVLVPSHLDPRIILTNDGSINPFRQVCRVETGTTNVYTSVTSAGTTHYWHGEGVATTDGAPTFSNPTATAYTGTVLVPISFEAYEDARGREGDIMMAIADSIDNAEASAFATGNGTTQPRGLVTALDANTNVEVANTTSNTFGLADVYNLYEQLPPRWRNARTTWFANLAIINDIRQFGTDSYNTQTVQLGARTVPAVLGHAILESSAMDGSIAAAGVDNILVVGDPQQYLIYDRLGTSVEFVPNLFSQTNGTPTGQRAWLAHHRTGGNTVVDTAFRMLQAETNS